MFAPPASVAAPRRRWTPPTSNTAPLSNKQKGIICEVARRAFDKMLDSGALEARADLCVSRHFKVWRRDEQFKAVSRSTLTACIQDNYKPLMAHFLNLAGEVETAMRYQESAALEPKRLASHALGEMCKKRGVTIEYANSICRQAWGCDLRDANQRQVWWIRRQVQEMKKPVVGSQNPTADNVPF
ncbi:MAG: hypothetical protein HZA88_00475 [Verrucomicrobia bacterium]|nr:hypothetical protein [Verrucomicrobiota bacterium]